MVHIPVAVQMYTLRHESAQDFAGTLKRVAELGFEGVEFAGYGGLAVSEVKALIDGLRLQAVSSHVPLETLQAELQKVIYNQKILGSEYIVVPFLSQEQRTDKGYQALISFLREAGEACRAEGITLCYHNHDFELDQLPGGRSALETIFDATTADQLHTELDVYWLKKAGENPVEWMSRYQGRSPLIHLKDMTTDEEQFFAELGTGGVDIDAVLEAGEEAGVQWWIVEQDESRRKPFDSLEISINYLKDRLPQLNN
ncbi:Sugar phosphate isomerase/epimerase [Thalassobacillus cyri]|uniref:Sugar phosphate isomerase/epimerase n=1 Tax=Thalassobacillus cyri TaxID=571932 RepID=A0A1H3Y8A6_9BACI|nr:sugar phosphate isomerase/epimerase [Thalassobacillus cyri]SEA07760.1 Sugar phosphate isomerase/epimerase [Thalassobacillus cyri]